MFLVKIDKSGFLERKFKKNKVAFQQLLNRILLINYCYLGSFSSDYVVNVLSEPLSVINTPALMIVGSRYKLYFENFLGIEKNSFLKQHFKQMSPEPLQFHASVWGFYTIYTAFHCFKFQKRKILKFLVLMYFHLKVITCNNSILSMHVCWLRSVFVTIYFLHFTFQFYYSLFM